MNFPEIFESAPAVFCVENEYQIMLPVKSDCLMWVEIGGKRYCDHTNGIMRSACRVHRVCVPMEILNTAKEYTVVTRKVIDRKPYFPEFEDEVHTKVLFNPLPESGDIRIFCMSDTHNLVDAPVDAYKNSGGAHLLVMNGDVPNHSGEVEYILTIYELAGKITGGSIPIVFSRGNHDTRGKFAESFIDYTPHRNGKSYFTFRLGSLWGMVLDCGEDKPDSNAEYGGKNGANCSEIFRRDETELIKKVIADNKNEYESDGVTKRVVIAHCPFMQIAVSEPPFNIETELYGEWTELICRNIKPTVMLFGHLHRSMVITPGSDEDYYKNLSCDAVVCGIPNYGANEYSCGCITVNDDGYSVDFVKGKA